MALLDIRPAADRQLC